MSLTSSRLCFLSADEICIFVQIECRIIWYGRWRKRTYWMIISIHKDFCTRYYFGYAGRNIVLCCCCKHMERYGAGKSFEDISQARMNHRDQLRNSWIQISRRIRPLWASVEHHMEKFILASNSNLAIPQNTDHRNKQLNATVYHSAKHPTHVAKQHSRLSMRTNEKWKASSTEQNTRWWESNCNLLCIRDDVVSIFFYILEKLLYHTFCTNRIWYIYE